MFHPKIMNCIYGYDDKNICLIHDKSADQLEEIQKFKHPKWICLNPKDALRRGREFDIVILFECEPCVELLSVAKKNIIFMSK